jgi:hypothetical protein
MNERVEPAPTRQPVMYVPHGGGPWPFVDMRGFMAERDIEALRAHRTLRSTPQSGTSSSANTR